MTNEQINQRIADLCAWNNKPVVRTDGKGRIWVTNWPNYCVDLNAMHEAEEHLRGNQFLRYAEMLDDIIGSLGGIRATARQRAEAFLRTLGKWEEVAK